MRLRTDAPRSIPIEHAAKRYRWLSSARRARTSYLVLCTVSIVAGVALGTSFYPGTGQLLSNTSYVGLSGGTGGASCPIATGWSQFPVAGPSQGEAAGGMAYDYLDGYVVYFGGYTGSSYVSTTWEYSGGCWKSLGTLSPSPDGRSEFAMAWDGTDSQVLLFGGADNGGGGVNQCLASNSYYFYMCGDTWGFSGGTWHAICNNGDGAGTGGSTCGTTPPPMNAPMMAYDPVQGDCNQGGVTGAPSTGCVFLFGGFRCASSCNTATEVDSDSGTLYEFFSNAWHSTTLTGPPARDFGGMTYDYTDGYLLLYGGETSSCSAGTCTYLGGSCVKDTAMSNYCDDAWSLTGGTWTQQCQGKVDWKGNTVGACYMPGTYATAMAYDNFQNYVFDFGGFNGWVSTYDSDAHGYVYGAFKWVAASAGAGDWTAVANPGATVSRFAPSEVYDSGTNDQYVLVLGGSNSGGYYVTTYVYK